MVAYAISLVQLIIAAVVLGFGYDAYRMSANLQGVVYNAEFPLQFVSIACILLAAMKIIDIFLAVVREELQKK